MSIPQIIDDMDAEMAAIEDEAASDGTSEKSRATLVQKAEALRGLCDKLIEAANQG